MSRKKILLFIVEGVTDEISLGLILSRLIDDKKIHFHIVGCDITSDYDSNLQNIKEKVFEQVKLFCGKYGLRSSDIFRVVHITDTDGAYIKQEKITKADTEGFIYSQDEIKARSIKDVIRRNQQKSLNMNKLYSCGSVSGIPYKMYYFSCNLEHVLHNMLNVPNDEKRDFARDFSDRFYGCEKDFIVFISDEEIAVHGNYKDTWDFIKIENNSLKRYSNFHLFFTEEEC